MSMPKGYKFGNTVCEICGRVVKDNYMVVHIKSNHKLPAQKNMEAVTQTGRVSGSQPVSLVQIQPASTLFETGKD